MNEAMPEWRAFTSDAPAPDDPDEDRARDAERQRAVLGARTVAIILAVAGACGLGAVVVLVAVLLLIPPSGAEVVAADLGETLDGALTTNGDPSAEGPAGEWDPGTALASGTRGSAVIVVDVAGAVMRPGLVRVGQGDRVGDAIAAAGGFSPRVDLAETSQSLNLAQPLDDGSKVLVPVLGAVGPRTVDARTEGDDRIDLNHADQAALESLPGIGPVTAARIIEAREEDPFSSIDDLRTREVVGESVFEDIRDLVRVSA